MSKWPQDSYQEMDEYISMFTARNQSFVRNLEFMGTVGKCVPDCYFQISFLKCRRISPLGFGDPTSEVFYFKSFFNAC